jgi:hypothetical protein
MAMSLRRLCTPCAHDPEGDLDRNRFPQEAPDLRFGERLPYRPTLLLGRTLNLNATQNRGTVGQIRR